jgi:hypothetical protein
MVKRAAIIGSQSLEFNGETERNVIQVAKIIHSLGYDVTIFKIKVKILTRLFLLTIM